MQAIFLIRAPGGMIEDNQSIFWDKIVSSQNNPHSVKWLKQSLKRNNICRVFASTGLEYSMGCILTTLKASQDE